MSIEAMRLGPRPAHTSNVLATYYCSDETARKVHALLTEEGKEGSVRIAQELAPGKSLIVQLQTPAPEGTDQKVNSFFAQSSSIDLFFKTLIQSSALALAYLPDSRIWLKLNVWSTCGRSATAVWYLYKTVSDLSRSGGQGAEKIIKAFIDAVVATSLNWKIGEEFFFDSKNQLVGRVLTVATFLSDCCEVKEQCTKFLRDGRLMEADENKSNANIVASLNESRKIAAVKGVAYATAVLVGFVAIVSFSSRFSGRSALLSPNSMKMWDLSGTLIKGAACYYEHSRKDWAHKDPFAEVKAKGE